MALFNSSFLVVVNFTASSYDIDVNETRAMIRVRAFGNFNSPFLVNVSLSSTNTSKYIIWCTHDTYTV